MVVINSGPRNNYREHQGRIIIPTSNNTFCKIVITSDDGTEYTLMNTYAGDSYVMSASVTLNCTSSISSFEFNIVNDYGRFYNVFNGGEYVSIYIDETDASTLVLRGRVDNVKNCFSSGSGFFINIDGRVCPELVDKTITGLQIASTIDSVLCNIFYENYSYLKLQVWNGSEWATCTSYDNITRRVTFDKVVSISSTLVNIVYQNKSGISVIGDALGRVGMDGYVYYDESVSQYYFRIFDVESINNGLGIGYGVNLLSVGDYGLDNDSVFNRVIAFGKTESSNILLLKTVEDSSSQSNLWIKDKVVSDSDCDSMTLIEERADKTLNDSLITTNSGRFTAIGLSGLMPGELVEISIPYTCNGLHRVVSLTHSIGNSVVTSVEVNKKSTRINDLFVSSLNSSSVTSELTNINNMKDSYTVFFDDDENLISNNGTQEIDGKLKLDDASTTGTATSVILDTSYDVTSCELRKYDNYSTDSDVYYVTNDGGNTWESVVIDGASHTFVSPGNRIGFRIVLNRTSVSSVSPAYESFCMLFK